MPSKYTRRNPLVIPAFLLLIALLIAIGMLVYGYFHYVRGSSGLRDESVRMQEELTQIEDILAHAVIIEDENAASGRVGLGCTVTVEDANGKLATYKITGSQEANPMQGKLSDDSPFGRAAVGKAVGDSFTYNSPMGTYTMKIVAITREG